MHSCAPLVKSDDIILDFAKMNKILDIDLENATATVQPGVKVYELCEEVKPYGYAVGTLGTIDWQGVIGAVMTGTHGGSLTTPSLHDFVESYTLIMGDGETRKVARQDEPELFSAMAPCMGVFGVVIECKIRLVKLQYLEAEMESMSFKEVIPRFRELMESNKYARVVVYPSLDMATVWKANPVENKGDAVDRGATDYASYTNFRNAEEKSLLEGFLIHQKNKEYEKGDTVLRQVVESQLNRLKHYEGAYNHVLCKERNHGIPHADIEFGMDYSRAEEILTSVREWYLTEGNRVPYYNFEIRTTKKDSAMMSCCYGRDTLYIDFQAKASETFPFFNTMEKLFEPYGYRKHWAKGMCHSNPENIIKQFPQIRKFIDYMTELDPEGKFRNEHIRLWYQKIKERLEERENLGTTTNNLGAKEPCFDDETSTTFASSTDVSVTDDSEELDLFDA
eukprot:CAMPEP_0194208584 /NCGR_PEP_ID=MMETSP0156-20130528/6993_1 /TAXON_ID=33649 /ORGANISM="Thalassionema nitzschioides, Strain L26-B" /LENGTH=449 /DNA_ID=CAMNT_0038935585 /DNA_START=1 /DNA_END=1347 /DNA_ORIENTATION=+